MSLSILERSEPMHFISPDDTGAPTRELKWYEVEIDYTHQLVRPGRDMDEFGLAAALSCPLETELCGPQEILFNIDLSSGRLPQDAAVLVEMDRIYPKGTDIDIEDYIATESIGWGTNVTTHHDLYLNNVEVVPVEDDHTVTLFTIEEHQVKDFRFRDRETRYKLDTCLAAEEGTTFCMSVTILNTFGVGLVEFDLSFGEEVIQEHDGSGTDCEFYRLCFFKDEFDFYSGNVFGPIDCTLDDVQKEYPTVTDQDPFNHGDDYRGSTSSHASQDQR